MSFETLLHGPGSSLGSEITRGFLEVEVICCSDKSSGVPRVLKLVRSCHVLCMLASGWHAFLLQVYNSVHMNMDPYAHVVVTYPEVGTCNVLLLLILHTFYMTGEFPKPLRNTQHACALHNN